MTVFAVFQAVIFGLLIGGEERCAHAQHRCACLVRSSDVTCHMDEAHGTWNTSHLRRYLLRSRHITAECTESIGSAILHVTHAHAHACTCTRMHTHAPSRDADGLCACACACVSLLPHHMVVMLACVVASINRSDRCFKPSLWYVHVRVACLRVLCMCCTCPVVMCVSRVVC